MTEDFETWLYFNYPEDHMAHFGGHPDEFPGSDEGSHYMSQTSAARLLEDVTCGGSKADVERIAAEQQRETPLERATRNNFGRDPYQIAPDSLGHRLRGSDASSFDVVCVCCGGTDRMGGFALVRPCASPLPPLHAPAGCATCDHAAKRFNGGTGATTCDLLRRRIVAYGNRVPEQRPPECPLPGGK